MENNCRCCGCLVETSSIKGNLLNHSVNYFSCSECGYFQTETPYWLDEAYQSPINISDTGLVHRNIRNSNLVLAALDVLSIPNGYNVLDYAGGYGLLVRIMRDKGINAFWFDPYCKNLFSIGFESDLNPDGTSLVTAFEAFEHFVFPIVELEKMLKISANILFSTNLIPDSVPEFKDWWYYGEEHGQHVGFFRLKTLHFIAKKYGKHLYTNGSDIHIFSDKKISPIRFKLRYLLYNYMPIVMSRKRTSKTWQDFLFIRNALLNRG